jgi:hypothetical protein
MRRQLNPVIKVIIIPALSLSFPRRRESHRKITNPKLQITNKLQIQISKITNWIPAYAGMTSDFSKLKNSIIQN